MNRHRLVLGASGAIVTAAVVLLLVFGGSSDNTVPLVQLHHSRPLSSSPSFHAGLFGFGPSAPAAGDILTTTNGQWSGNPTSFGYAWQDCNAGTTTCATAAGSPTNTNRYVIVVGDANGCAQGSGCTIRVRVTATYAGGQTALQDSVPTVTVTGGTPGSLTPPVIS